jgi:hypothetical protein
MKSPLIGGLVLDHLLCFQYGFQGPTFEFELVHCLFHPQ